jgi:transposase-like protein
MAPEKLGSLEIIRKHLSTDGSDAVRTLVKAMAQELMDAEVDALCGAQYKTRSDERVNQRNGYRYRDWDTRAGTVELEIPKLRQGTYFPDWLLEPRRRGERALVGVIAECYLLGVSTRRVDRLVKVMGLQGMKKSQVSELASELDSIVNTFRNRPLDSGPYAYVWVDALVHKCREGGRIVNVATVVATGVNANGHREVLGVDVVTTEDGAAWLAFLRGLVARGLSGVQLVTSDAHEGLKQAIASVFPGAGWQRCRTHFMRNLLTRVRKADQDMVASLVRSIFMQPDANAVRQQHTRVVEQLMAAGFDDAATMLVDAEADVLAFAHFPKEHWRQIWSNNPEERLNKEIRRRTDVVGIFPNRAALIRLVGAMLAEQNDEWAVSRRYLNVEMLHRTAKKQEPLPLCA